MDSRIQVQGWRKMEAEAQYRAEDLKMQKGGLIPATGTDKASLSKISKCNQLDNMLTVKII